MIVNLCNYLIQPSLNNYQVLLILWNSCQTIFCMFLSFLKTKLNWKIEKLEAILLTCREHCLNEKNVLEIIFLGRAKLWKFASAKHLKHMINEDTFTVVFYEKNRFPKSEVKIVEKHLQGAFRKTYSYRNCC